MSAELVLVGQDGEPFTTSLVMAAGTDNEHSSVLRLVRDNVADFEEFGRVGFEIQPFETAGGTQRREVAILNEQQATLLVTYMRNNETVRAFKKRLVRAFYELRSAATVDPLPAIPQTYADALRACADEYERAESEKRARIEAEHRAKELEAPASAWSHMAESSGDYAVADAAKVLTRDPSISIGGGRLFSFMAAEGWIYRNRGTNRWKAYQTQVDCGRLCEKLGTPFLHEPTGEMRVPEPTIRITPKGLAELHKRLGGSSQLALMAEVS